MQILPMCHGSDLEVYHPDISFFINKMKNKESFSLIRHQHGWWERVITGRGRAEQLLKRPLNLDNDDDLMVLAERISIPPTRNKRWHGLNPKVSFDILKMIRSQKPDNLFYAVSDRDRWLLDIPPPDREPDKMITIRSKTVRNEINLFVKEMCYNGAAMRLWSLQKKLNQFFQFNDYKYVLVGPKYYSIFGKLIGLNDFNFIETHYLNGTYEVENTLKETMKYISSTPTVYIFTCSVVGQWITIEMHNKSGIAFMIDFGRAIDVYCNQIMQEAAENGDTNIISLIAESNVQNFHKPLRDIWDFESVLKTARRRNHKEIINIITNPKFKQKDMF